MVIETLRLRDFRNYMALEMRPHPGVNLIFGQNGSGKTNLLEAVHYCALGRSHRVSQDREVVRKGAMSGACGVIVRGKTGRVDVAVKLTPMDTRKKQAFVDRKKVARLSELMGKVRCVIFSPEDLQLVKDGAQARRRYVDMLLSQLSPAYFVALQQYQRALDERNAILRQFGKFGTLPEDMLDAFEQAMAEPCRVILPMRRRMIARLSEISREKYGAIAGRAGEDFAMRYAACVDSDEDVAARLREAWKAKRREDGLRGTTSLGPHREDVALTLRGREMKLFASQGQIRTAALCMKLSQLEVIREESGEPPILLLDDVMSELDMRRRTRLLEEIDGVQTFVTCTDESDLDGCDIRRTYHVSLNEELQACLAEVHPGEIAETEAEDEEPDFT